MFTRWIMQMALVWCGAALLWGQSDPPARGVARIALIQGDVSVKRGDSGEWVAAAPNAPLVVEDRVLTGVNSKTEVQFDYANIMRLSSQAELRLAELEQARYLVQLASGTATFRVLRNSQADVEISTPNISIRPIKKGVYRMHVLADGTTEIIVQSGEVEIYTTRGTERLKSGRMMMVRGTASDPEFQVVSAPDRDLWDRWNEDRDRQLERSISYRYVDPTVYGAEDLDYHGSWVYDPPYGWVWSPRVAVGWAPYRYGRWAWVDWYGWSWVSYDPWGWAPYHYGRWYYGARGWAWWPGGLRVRHSWSPGLVAWVGFGGGGVGVGFGRVGWIPLAPYEPYHAWYGWNTYRGWGNRTVNNVTVVNNVNITNVYRNARVNDGITALDSRDFVAGRAGTRLRLSENDIQRADLVRGTLPLAPERASLRMADRDLSPGVAAATSRENGRFYSRREPGSVERVSFDDQRRGVEEAARRTFAGSREGDGGRTEAGRADRSGIAERIGARQGGDAPAVSDRMRQGESRRTEAATNDAGAGGTANDGRGWRRLGERQTSTSPADVRSESGGDAGQRRTSESGWRRFGQPRGAESGGGSMQTGGDLPASGGAATPRERSTASEGWRRFGDPRGGSSADTNRSTDSAGSPRQRSVFGGSDGASFPRRPRETQDGGSGGSMNRTEFPRSREQRMERSAPTERATPTERSAPPERTSPAEHTSPERQRIERPQMERRSRPDGPSADASPSGGTGRTEFFRSNRSSEASGGGSEPLRFSPPVVRERSTPSGSMSAAPRMRSFGGESRPSVEAPRHSGGGGGGGGTSSGGGRFSGSSSGGGGAARSSGGGSGSMRGRNH